MSDVPPGWYPDPQQPGQLRWWDGTNWSSHTQMIPAQVSQGSPGFQPTGSDRSARPKRRVFVGFSILAVILGLMGASVPLYQMVMDNAYGDAAPMIRQSTAELLLSQDLTATSEVLQRIASASDATNPKWATSDTFMKALVAEHMPILLEPDGGVRSVEYETTKNPFIEQDPVSGIWRNSDSAYDPGEPVSDEILNEFVETHKAALRYTGVLVDPRTLRITATFSGTSRYGKCSLTLNLVDGPAPPSNTFYMSDAGRHIRVDAIVCLAAS